jgi:hypothetical protein
VGLPEGEFAADWEEPRAHPIPPQAPAQPEQPVEGLPRRQDDQRVGLSEGLGLIEAGGGLSLNCMI